MRPPIRCAPVPEAAGQTLGDPEAGLDLRQEQNVAVQGQAAEAVGVGVGRAQAPAPTQRAAR